MLVCFSKCRPS